MSENETLAYIESEKWTWHKPGLSRTRELLKALGNPEKKLKFAHIAGTNGKGSTAASMASVLRKAGYRTGLYTSPYIISFNERMQVDGEMITDEELAAIVEKIRPFADAMEDTPTEFELITAIAMQYFMDKKCDIVVLEVGLGGELDSTNVIDVPEVAVITAIGLDHVEYLGHTLPEIASAKAGIIKGGPVAFYGGEPEVEEVFVKKCRETNSPLQIVDRSRLHVHSIDLDACVFDFEPYHNIRLPLVGTYQPYNAALAITALELMREKGWKISDKNIIDGLNDVYWPGRFEVIDRSPVFVLDGAHNSHGIRATAASLAQHFKDQKLVFLLGVMADKDVDVMMDCIAPLAKSFVTVRPDNDRAMAAADLAKFLNDRYGKPATPRDTIEDGVALARELAGPDGVVVALGSLYFSGDIRKAVEKIKEAR